MINFNAKMLKLQDLVDKMLTLQSDIVVGKKLNVQDLAGKMLKLFYPTGKILMITISVPDWVTD